MNKRTGFPWRQVFPISRVYARFDPKGLKICQIAMKSGMAHWNIYVTDVIDGDAVHGQCPTLDCAFELVDETLRMHGWDLLCTDEASETYIRL